MSAGGWAGGDGAGEDDRIVELLRGLDPGEPPVALGPGASLRGIAARRRTRRHAVGAVLALALVGGGVAGGFLSARQDADGTAVAAGPMSESSVLGVTPSPHSATPVPAVAPSAALPPLASVPPTHPAASASPGPQSSRAETGLSAGPAAVVLAVTGGLPQGAPAAEPTTVPQPGPVTAGGTAASSQPVFPVGGVMTVTVSVSGGDASSVWFVNSYSFPGAGASMSLVSCTSYKAAGGKPRSTLRQSWSPHLNTAGNYLVSVDVTDICGKGGTRHAEEWVSVVAAPATPTPSVVSSPTPSPTSGPGATPSPTSTATASPSS